MSGEARLIDKPPNAKLPSQLVSLDWDVAQIVVEPNQRYGGLFSNLLIQNRDAVNPITVRLNNGRPFTIAPNISIPFNEQWIDLIDITPNAATGDGNFVAQVVKNKYLR